MTSGQEVFNTLSKVVRALGNAHRLGLLKRLG